MIAIRQFSLWFLHIMNRQIQDDPLYVEKLEKDLKDWIEKANFTLGCLGWAVFIILIMVSKILFAIK